MLICNTKTDEFFKHIMNSVKQKNLSQTEIPVWYNVNTIVNRPSGRCMELLTEFVDFESEKWTEVAGADSFACCESDCNLFAKFLMMSLLFLPEPKITAEFYAQHLGVSRTSFFSHLKNVSVEHPFEILSEIRICISKKLLAYSERTVNEIANDVGKENTGYFSTYFKNKTGMTPLAFRKSWQSGDCCANTDNLGVFRIRMTDGSVWKVNIERFAEMLSRRRDNYLELVREL